MPGVLDMQLEQLGARFGDVSTRQLPSGTTLVTVPGVRLPRGVVEVVDHHPPHRPARISVCAARLLLGGSRSPSCTWRFTTEFGLNSRPGDRRARTVVLVASDGTVEPQPRHTVDVDECGDRSNEAGPMSRVRFPAPLYSDLASTLLDANGLESCAIAYGKRSLVETAIGRYKGLIGRRLRARSFPASEDRGCHWLNRAQPHAGKCTPELCPLPRKNRRNRQHQRTNCVR